MFLPETDKRGIASLFCEELSDSRKSRQLIIRIRQYALCVILDPALPYILPVIIRDQIVLVVCRMLPAGGFGDMHGIFRVVFGSTLPY
jgi:hypothetical protein